MTRKDYERLAVALARALKACETQNQERGVQRAALCVADYIASTSTKFDRALFLRNCGVQP